MDKSVAINELEGKLNAMAVGDEIEIFGHKVICVPGGWIYVIQVQGQNYGIARPAVFVPAVKRGAK